MATSSTAGASPAHVLARLHELALTDNAAAADLYAEDGVHELPFAPAGVPSRTDGREALRAAMASQQTEPSPVSYDRFDDVVIWQTTDPEVIISEYEVAGTVTASGRGFRLRQLILLRVRDGEILLTRSYFNPAELAAVLQGD